VLDATPGGIPGLPSLKQGVSVRATEKTVAQNVFSFVHCVLEARALDVFWLGLAIAIIVQAGNNAIFDGHFPKMRTLNTPINIERN